MAQVCWKSIWDLFINKCKQAARSANSVKSWHVHSWVSWNFPCPYTKVVSSVYAYALWFSKDICWFHRKIYKEMCINIWSTISRFMLITGVRRSLNENSERAIFFLLFRISSTIIWFVLLQPCFCSRLHPPFLLAYCFLKSIISWNYEKQESFQLMWEGYDIFFFRERKGLRIVEY